LFVARPLRLGDLGVNIGDPNVPVGVADIDLSQTVTFVGSGGQDLEAKAACGGPGGVWIATVKSDFKPSAAWMGKANGIEHGMAVVGVVSMDHPLCSGEGTYGEVGIRVDNSGAKNLSLKS
jgi:hypothetical protein